MIWRGPMVMSAITQMLREVAWGDLDVLVVDIRPEPEMRSSPWPRPRLWPAPSSSRPRRTSRSSTQGAAFPCSPVEIPILGIVENMATFVCPHCGQTSHIFGHGGARAGG